MISVDSLYQKVSQISRKGSTGYLSNDIFNRALSMAQENLFLFYMERYENSITAHDALLPFLKSPVLPIVSGFVAYPSDYRYRIAVHAGYVAGGSTTYHNCPYLEEKEEAESVNSTVRRPDATKRRFYHALTASGIKIYPENHVGVIRLKYLSAPPVAARAVTIDVNNVVENYNPTGTIDLIWGAQDETNLVDIMLALFGIQQKQSELIEWVRAKNQTLN